MMKIIHILRKLKILLQYNVLPFFYKEKSTIDYNVNSSSQPFMAEKLLLLFASTTRY